MNRQVLTSMVWVAAVTSFGSPVQARESAESILDPSFGVKKIDANCEFTEGPAIDRDGNLYFSDGPNNRVMKLDPDGRLGVFLEPSGAANGLLIDQDNRLLMCQSSREGGGRAVAGVDLETKKVTVLTSEFQGKRYIAPNDLTIDGKGRIYFTDPLLQWRKVTALERRLSDRSRRLGRTAAR